MKSFAILVMLSAAALLSLPSSALQIPSVVNYSFEPLHPAENDIVRFRLDVEGCFHHPFGAHLVDGQSTIEVRISGEDFPCDPSDPANTTTPRFYDVGKLPAGAYTTRVLFCVPGPPDYICDVLQEGTLVVSNAPGLPRVVPTLSLSGLALLTATALFGGLIAFRWR